MALQFSTTREQAQLHGIKVLVHARAGIGKTTLCATAPEPIILSAEAGLLSLAAFDIPVIVIRSFIELQEAYDFITKNPHAARFKTVCLDSITEIGEQCLTAEKAKTKDPRKAYGEMQDIVIDWVRKFRDIQGKHVYISAKQDMVKDDVTGISLYGPKAPGRQVGPALPYLFDEVFSLEVGQTPEGVKYRYLRTAPSVQFEAKDRSNALDEIEEPHLGKIFAKILAKTNKP
jgi:hypothetical protein